MPDDATSLTLPGWPVTRLTFADRAIRVAKRADHSWFVVDDIVALIPDAHYTLADLDDEDRWRGQIATDDGNVAVDVISEKGALTLATLLPGSTDPDEMACRFRLWLWHDALPVLGIIGVPAPAAEVSRSSPKVGHLPANAKKVLNVIQRHNGVTLTGITRATQYMGAEARRAALALLEEGGAIVASAAPSGGRPSTCYRPAP